MAISATLTGSIRIGGTPGDDTLAGTPADEDIHGGAGGDDIAGNGGKDLLDGGPGDDYHGDDTRYTIGRDYLMIGDGGAGNDTLRGGGGDDRLDGSAGDFLARVYEHMLHRAPDPGAYAYWLEVVQQGATEGQVLAAVSESAELHGLLVGQMQLGIAYLPYGA